MSKNEVSRNNRRKSGKAAGWMAVCAAAALLCGQALPAQAAEGFSYEDVSDLTFYFSSGVGAWGTEVSIQADGSFQGSYHDSDMGDVGDGYPHGTIYVCNFSGQLGEPEQINEYTYSAPIQDMELEREVGETEIKDEIRYVYSEPYGLDGTDYVVFYLEGAPLSECPEKLRQWMGYYDPTGTEETRLAMTGLYNETQGSGFAGYERQDASEENTGAEIDMELSELETQAAELENQINNGSLSQSELNQLSAELYTLWDDELNSMWGRIKELLSEEEMAQLTSEELAWIEEKEAAAAEAGAEFEGGSMQPFMEYSTAARLTKERVYELAVYLR